MFRYCVLLLTLFLFVGCEKEKFPLHSFLRKKFQTMSDEYDHFTRIDLVNNESDSTKISREEFLELSEQFLRDFPDVSDMEGSVDRQERFVQHRIKRKVINYNLPADKGQTAEVSIEFREDAEGKEKFSHASYYLDDGDNRPGFLIDLQVSFNPHIFRVSKRDVTYYSVICY